MATCGAPNDIASRIPKSFGWRAALKLRRPLGLYAFLYVCLHFLTFVGLDYGFDLELILDTLTEKRCVSATWGSRRRVEFL